MKLWLALSLLAALLGAEAAPGDLPAPLVPAAREALAAGEPQDGQADGPAEGLADDPAENEPLEKGPIFSDETDAVLVEVPVEVLAGGQMEGAQPVAGLAAADFELYDNGRRQEILGVEAIDRGRGRFDADLPVVARRHFLLVFDLSFTSPAALARAREAALETVERRLDPSDLVGVATFRLQEGVRLLLGFSPDRSQVRVTLDALEKKPELSLRPDPLQIYLGQASGAQSALRPDAPAAREETYAHLQHLIDRESAARTRRDVAVLSDSLPAWRACCAAPPAASTCSSSPRASTARCCWAPPTPTASRSAGRSTRATWRRPTATPCSARGPCSTCSTG